MTSTQLPELNNPEAQQPVAYTVGHGSRTLEEFLALPKNNGIQCLVDIRAYPGSRRHPHFAREALASTLAAEDMRYVWEGPDLGGFRHHGLIYDGGQGSLV